jgi:hypothetical protein
MGDKGMAAALKIFAHLAKIINFAIMKNGERSSLIPEWLAAAWQIDDAKAARTDDHRSSYQYAFIVRTTVDDCSHHPADDRLARFLRSNSDRAADSAHS